MPKANIYYFSDIKTWMILKMFIDLKKLLIEKEFCFGVFISVFTVQKKNYLNNLAYFYPFTLLLLEAL